MGSCADSIALHLYEYIALHLRQLFRRNDKGSGYVSYVVYAENELLITAGTPAAEKASIREVFGATEEDVNKLRIVSLYEVCSSHSGRTRPLTSLKLEL